MRLLITLLLLFPIVLQAQLVNMEETWQEFLKEEKTSNISKLVKPEKAQAANYIKYSLMYANSYFCADNIVEADKMMKEVESMGATIQDNVPGFKERYVGLKGKIKAYKDLLPVWQRFLKDKTSVSRKDLAAIPDAATVCEKGTLCKFFYMMAHAYYCEANLTDSRNQFDNRVQKLSATSFDPKRVEGLSAEITMMKTLWAGIDKLNPAWDSYIQTGISPGFDLELPVINCYTVPNIKECLLKAAANFCGKGAEMLKRIKELQALNAHPMPADVADKIQWLENEVNKWNKDLAELNGVWDKFVTNDKLPSGAQYKHIFVCDRESEVKAYLMDGLNNPCVLGKTALDSIAKIQKRHNPTLGNVTTSKLTKLQGLVDTEKQHVATLNKAWADFLPDDKLSGAIDFVFEYCDKVAQTQSYIIDGMLDVCNKGQKRLDDIATLRAEHSPKLDEKTIEKIEKLQAWVDKINKESADLKKAWEHLLSSHKVSEELAYKHEFICNRLLEVQAYLLDGFTNPCLNGEKALAEIAKVVSAHNPTLDANTQKKLDELKNITQHEKQNVAVLKEAWKDFLPDDKLSSEAKFVFEYCDKMAQAQAYIIDGTINFCANARKRLADLSKLQEDFALTLDEETETKAGALFNAVKQADKDLADLDAAFTLAIETDTAMHWYEGFPPADKVIRSKIRLVDFYCDKIAQTKSWVIKGNLDPCDKGEGFLKQIEELKKSANLTYDKDLACQIHRLKGKVWQCKYWALVLKARAITHQERETFGPASAKIMYTDLNSSKQPCETTVQYEPLGFIGIKYVISPSLCQDADMAKMGDPLYYKKIATWQDKEVLQKYCEASMRCKEGFFIYLEGHTDGNRFSGRTYPEAINIPEGTPFTHFIGKDKSTKVDTVQKATRNITSSLQNNMELGIARAWSVRNHLEFMKVPITIGAYEHPASEKGGQYRKIDIELNMTNLLLDFYEKTLARLVKESGIGGKPKARCE